MLTFDLSDEVARGTENVGGVKSWVFGDDGPQDAQQLRQSLLNHTMHAGWLLWWVGGSKREGRETDTFNIRQK